jgi:hypothetical protein
MRRLSRVGGAGQAQVEAEVIGDSVAARIARTDLMPQHALYAASISAALLARGYL